MKEILKRKIICIDLGTNVTRVALDKKEILVESIVALDKNKRRFLGYGSDCKKNITFNSEDLLIKNVINDGEISNISCMEYFISSLLRKVRNNIELKSADLLVSVPTQIDTIHQNALLKVFSGQYTHFTFLIPQIIAAAVGSGMDIFAQQAQLIINLGAGVVEFMVIKKGKTISYFSTAGLGKAIEQNIADYVLKKYSLIIDQEAVVDIKKSISKLIEDVEDSYYIEGRNVDSEEIKQLRLNSGELVNVIRQSLENITKLIKESLSKLSVEDIRSISKNGAVITGGHANLKNIDVYFSKLFSLPFFIAENPQDSVISGLKIIAQDMERFEAIGVVAD